MYVNPSKVVKLLELTWIGAKHVGTAGGEGKASGVAQAGLQVRLPSLRELKARVKAQLTALRPDHVRHVNPSPYKVTPAASWRCVVVCAGVCDTVARCRCLCRQSCTPSSMSCGCVRSPSLRSSDALQQQQGSARHTIACIICHDSCRQQELACSFKQRSPSTHSPTYATGSRERSKGARTSMNVFWARFCSITASSSLSTTVGKWSLAVYRCVWFSTASQRKHMHRYA